ncbi:A disintegrin and metalloproteinase with thrombospondin motifs adt-1-like [Littorina saxatilis]|uniref:C-type lectin domain-containing protein n=1 Tax=Littorina saxatilis TaxID=31220 RepID=A0AAN9G9R2_9CAEN
MSVFGKEYGRDLHLIIVVIFIVLFGCFPARASKNDKESKDVAQSVSACPNGPHVQDDKTCYYYHNSPSGWEGAEAKCRSEHGLQVIFKNKPKAVDVLQKVSDLRSSDSTNLMWVGISRSQDGMYRWTDGSTANGAWTNKINTDDKGQGRGCVAVDLDQVTRRGNDVSFYLKDCSASSLSFLCMVDTANAVWTGWGTWSDCSTTCGKGIRSRQRTCLNSNYNSDNKKGEKSCSGDDAEKEECSSSACPVYTWETWGTWTACSATCGEGQRSRSRRCVDSESGGQGRAQCKGDENETARCNMERCAVYSWETWGAWTSCSVSCGGGQRSRSRQCVDGHGVSGGQDRNQCQGDGDQRERCNTDVCSVYSWETWGTWSACSATCGEGQRSRSRRCVDSESGDQGRTQCKGDENETARCNMERCAVYSWETWGAWTSCSVSCGGGQRSRSRQCVDSVSGSQGHNQCQGDGDQRERCNTDICSVYTWETWSAWTTCSATCVGGQRSRSRRCVDSVSGGQGRTQCKGDENEIEPCNTDRCAAYEWETWSEWSACSATCGKGQRSRSRQCVDGASRGQGQTQCAGTGKETDDCSADQQCTAPTSYSWEMWSAWTACSATCGGGQRSRSRRCVDSVSKVEARGDGSCPGLNTRNEPCGRQKCPGPLWQEWGQWTVCGATCGKGVRSRVRTCALQGVTSDQCKGKSSNEHICIRNCKGLSKLELVHQIKSQLTPEKAAKLEKWAEDTTYVQEHIFNAENLQDYAMTGHVMQTLKVADRIACVLKCLSLGGCKSFNFWYGPEAADGAAHACELNSASRDEAIRQVQKRDGFMLYDLSMFIPYI